MAGLSSVSCTTRTEIDKLTFEQTFLDTDHKQKVERHHLQYRQTVNVVLVSYTNFQVLSNETTYVFFDVFLNTPICYKSDCNHYT